ncbi:MAG: YifB family Mg chelatase-like AAA ATPase [Candidatus Peribacteraceae bacterium]|nr:YifB family Mg chelatase-like AAA ATPase [Candidatus Peribacteraceae bacterium]MDD5739636.1 YifB family Mg chelatase-like AAA ATPase [Candidatus Peribacteraceae bacterium]
MLTKLTSFATIGLESERITVEVGSSPGEGKIFIVGLGDMSVQESKQRVRHALRAQGYHFSTGLTITVNLAPANLRKAGPRYDLAIALGILLVNGSITLPEDELAKTAFLGELALDGSLRHITGILPAAIACRKMGIKRLVVPAVNGSEAALIPGVEVIAAEHISEVISILRGEAAPALISAPASSAANIDPEIVDFADIRGQEHAKRALEIAAAGGHNVLLSGAPGAGKTLLARAFRGILPPLSQEESIEVTRIYSVANLLPPEVPLITNRPFRVVHHTASGVSIVGGGQTPGPGEISLAHRGVLFLDELAEFPAQVLEVLRQPLEDRRITITRAQGSVTFPADFTMIAAMNPPRFTAGSKERVHRRISAPLLDRIDLTVNMQPVPIDDLQRPAKTNGDTTAAVLKRVLKARMRQASRFALHAIRTNKEMGVKEIDALCPLKADAQRLLSQAVDRMGLSARGYHRAIKVARTIADLADAEHIGIEHVAEALQYRQNIDE